MPSLAGRLRLDDFGPELIAEFRAGRAVRLDDPAADARSQGSLGAYQAAGGICAGNAVPLLKDRRFVAALYAHQAEPRQWTDDEAELLRSVAECTWAAVERARAETVPRT